MASNNIQADTALNLTLSYNDTKCSQSPSTESIIDIKKDSHSSASIPAHHSTLISFNSQQNKEKNVEEEEMYN